MKIQLSSVSKATALNYIGVGLGYLNLIILLPLVFSTEIIGQYQVVARFGVLFGGIASLGIPAAINRFSPLWSLNTMRVKVLRTFKQLLAIGLLIAISAGYFFPHSFPLANSESGIVVLAICLAASFALKNVFSAILRVKKRISTIAFFTDVFVRVVLSIFILIQFKFQIFSNKSLIYSYVGIELLSVLVLSFYSKQASESGTDFEPQAEFKRSALGQYMAFAFLTTLGSSLVMQIDTLMVAEFSPSSFDSAAIYAIAFFIATIVEIPKRAITQIAIPSYAEAFSRNDHVRVKEVYKSSSIIQFVAGVIVFTLVWTNLDQLFGFMPNGEVFAAGKYVVFWIGLARIIELAFGANNDLIANSSFYKFNLYALLLLAGFNIGLNFVLIKQYDFLGAAIATCISMSIFSLIKLIKIYKEGFAFPFSWIHLVFLLFAVVIVFVINPLLPNFTTYPVLNIMILSVIYGTGFLISLVVFRKPLLAAYFKLK